MVADRDSRLAAEAGADQWQTAESGRAASPGAREDGASAFDDQDWAKDTRQPASSQFGSRQAGKPLYRLSRWKPSYVPLAMACFITIVVVSWRAGPYSLALSWPLAILWTWPILNTIIGIRGIARTRKALRASEARWRGNEMVVCRDFLIVIVPTIGRDDTYPALERSVLSYVACLPHFFPHLRIDVVIEEDCEAYIRIERLVARSNLIRLVTVPNNYQTPCRTKFKARANHYSHQLRIYERETHHNLWILHMDDDTGVGPDTALAMARFIEEQFRAGPDAKHMAQGILTYPREYAVSKLAWLADSVRPADDVSYRSACTGSGTPRAGLHGELLLVRASVEARIGWDFGPRSIVEDAQFALIFSDLYKGRSAWFAGRCYGASPATIREFVRQRERWTWGLTVLVFNRSVRLRYRAFLAYSALSWAAGPIQNVAAVVVAGAVLSDLNTSPETLLIISLLVLNLAYVIWMYWEGLRLNAEVSADGRRHWFEPILVIFLIPVLALMEGLGGLRGFLKFVRRAEHKFVVVAKPS